MGEKKREAHEIARRMWDAYHSWTCVVCGASVEYEEQVGHNVYARPCGHYLWNGKARGPRPNPDQG